MDLFEKIKKNVGSQYEDINRVALAFSGGLDTTVIVSILHELGKEVVTCTLDLGNREDMAKIKKHAEKLGVKKHYSINAQKEFIKEYIWPSVKANGRYEGAYPLATALGRPLIAKKLVEIAKIEKADAAAHGSTGKGNDQIRIESGIRALSSLKILAPIRDWNLWRDEEIEYAKSRSLDVKTTKEKPYSVDQNIWGRSIECGQIENPEIEPPEDAYEWTAPLSSTPDKVSNIEIFFEKGVPQKISIDKKEYTDEMEMLEQLTVVAGKHGIGRIDTLENRTIGFKSREVYEAPSAVVILKAHKDLEKYILTKDTIFHKNYLDNLYSTLVYEGKWFSPLRIALDKFYDEIESNVSGSVKLKLIKGNIIIAGRTSNNALYDKNIATYDKSTTWNQFEGGAFSKLFNTQCSAAYKIKYKPK